MLLIGSRALKFVAPQLVDHEPRDYDLIATPDEFKELVRAGKAGNRAIAHPDGKIVILGGRQPVEVEIAWPGTSAELLMSHCGEEEYLEELGVWATVPRLEALLALKASHRFRKDSPHFLKTRRDYLAIRSVVGDVPENMHEFLKLREKETYTYAHPKLNVSKKEFFNPEQVTYVYDHDTIHLAMAHPLRPAYQEFQDSEVRCRSDLFEALPEETRLRSVLEESYVLALERSQIPFPGHLTPKQSFLIALEKVCTSISSGWWREFAWENYDKVLALYSDSYVDRLREGLELGIVQPAQEGAKVA